MSMMDPASMAMQMVMIQRQPFDIQYATQKNSYQAQLDAWKDIDSAFSSFSSALDKLNETDSSFVKNSAIPSEEGFFTASASSSAREGSYDLFVSQLAKAQQDAFTLKGDALPEDGEITIELNGETITVDFAEFNSDGDKNIQDLADFINVEADELGIEVSATVVQSNGERSLVLTSNETGEENAFTVSSDDDFSDYFEPRKELNKAQDSIVYLGGEGGLKLRNSTNAIDNAIYGVTIELTKAQQSGEEPITLVVGSDTEASTDAVKEFVDAYNNLVNTLNKHTKTDFALENEDDADDDDDDDDNSITITTAGALAGDGTARSLKNMLNNVTRGEFDEGTLYSIGIEANRDGTLKIDSARFEQALAENPEKIDEIFLGENGAIASLEKAIEPYTGSANSGSNLLKSKQDTLQGNIDRVDDKSEQLDYRMEKTYNRYLRQYTSMQQTMSQMQSTGSMFMF